MVSRDNLFCSVCGVLSGKCITGDHEEMDFKNRYYTHVTSASPQPRGGSGIRWRH